MPEQHEQHKNSDTYMVTGASSGIGHGTAIALAKQGYQVLAIARRAHLLETLANQYPESITPISADLATDKGISVVSNIEISSKRLLGIVHAAGTSVALADYNETDTGKLVEDLAVHVAAPIALNNGLGKKLIGSRILYIDSYSAQAPRIGWGSYSIIKAAAQMAARAAAAELTESTVIRVFPGAVKTPLVKLLLESGRTSPTVETFKELEATGKMVSPSEIGDYLANILIRAKPVDLAGREAWDYNNTNDHIFK